MFGDYFLLVCYGMLPYLPNENLEQYHLIIFNLLFIFSLYFYYKTCSVKPGIINKKSQELYLN